MVRSAIDMGHGLGLKVVAEGIETEAAAAAYASSAAMSDKATHTPNPYPSRPSKHGSPAGSGCPVIAFPVDFPCRRADRYGDPRRVLIPLRDIRVSVISAAVSYETRGHPRRGAGWFEPLVRGRLPFLIVGFLAALFLTGAGQRQLQGGGRLQESAVRELTIDERNRRSPDQSAPARFLLTGIEKFLRTTTGSSPSGTPAGACGWLGNR